MSRFSLRAVILLPAELFPARGALAKSPSAGGMTSFICPILLIIAANSVSAQVTVRAFNSLQRLHISTESPKTTPSLKAGANILVEAAQGETESFQILVKTKDTTLRNVTLNLSDLLHTSKKGVRIGKDRIVRYREHFINVAHKTPDFGGDQRNKTLGTGYYPDALIPFLDPATGEEISGAELDASPITLTANSLAIYWLDVSVPASAPPGYYVAKYTLNGDDFVSSGYLVLRVWNFTLPSKPSFHSAFGMWSRYNQQNIISLLRNKIGPESWLEVADQELLINQYGLSSANIGFWSNAIIANCNMLPAPSAAEVAARAAQFSSSLFKYNYTADEITQCTNLDERMKEWGRTLQAEGVKNLVVMVPTSRLDANNSVGSVVDIWVVLPAQYIAEREAVTRAISRGQEVWIYSALNQTNGLEPSWLMDFSPLNFRITGFLSAQTGITGMLYWNTDWGIYKGRDPWVDGFYFTIGDLYFPGDGNFFYPGAPAGMTQFVESIRLKWLRDAVEDYEYFQILRSCGLGARARRTIAKVARDWNDWSDDSRTFRQVRSSLGNLIDRNLCAATNPIRTRTKRLTRATLLRMVKRLGLAPKSAKVQEIGRIVH